MLEELAKKDDLWRKKAFLICKDKDLADEIVQEMYIKFYTKNNLNTDEFYIIATLRNLFLNYIKEKKTISLNEFYNLQDNNTTFEPTDYELEIINQCNKLPFLQNGLLKESYDLSVRQISKKYEHIDYGLIHRELNKARKTILGVDIDLYKNKRLKYVKKK